MVTSEYYTSHTQCLLKEKETSKKCTEVANTAKNIAINKLQMTSAAPFNFSSALIEKNSKRFLALVCASHSPNAAVDCGGRQRSTGNSSPSSLSEASSVCLPWFRSWSDSSSVSPSPPAGLSVHTPLILRSLPHNIIRPIKGNPHV